MAPDLKFSDGDKVIDELVIGDDLYVSATSLPPDDEVRVVLMDDTGLEISVVDATTDSEGELEVSLLWLRTGIVGCDTADDVDPSEYRYVDFAQADFFLQGKMLGVQVVDSADMRVAQRALPVRNEPRTRYFFSDQLGCPRDEFEHDEDVYLSALDSHPEQNETAIFFVDAGRPLRSDGSFLEVREDYQSYPQVLSPSFAHGDWTIPLWAGTESRAGLYGMFLREFSGYLDPQWSPEDTALGVDPLSDDISPHGITIKSWSCPTGDDLCERDEVIPIGQF